MYKEYVFKLRGTAVLLFFLLASYNVRAQRQVINYLSAGSNICTPVKVKTNLGTFDVYHSETRVTGNISSIEAWDCNGRKILDLEADRWSNPSSGPYERWYVFNTLYPESSSNNYGDYSGGTNHNVGTNWAKSAQYHAQIPLEGYPNLQLQVGASRLYGDFARLKFCGGGEGGFACYAGIGKDHFFKGEYKNRLLWHAAVGYYNSLDDENCDFTFCISYAQTSMLKDKVMGLDATFSYYFGDSTRFGLFIGGGGGVTSPLGYITGGDGPEESEVTWDINIGIAVKLWNE